MVKTVRKQFKKNCSPLTLRLCFCSEKEFPKEKLSLLSAKNKVLKTIKVQIVTKKTV